MMFGEEILNAKQLVKKLGISKSYLYELLEMGLPYRQLGNKGRKYYVYEEVTKWIFENLGESDVS